MTYIEIFEHLHQNPELSLEEFETTAFIKKILTEEGIEILDLPLKTGLVARIKGTAPQKGNKPGAKIAFRVDIDALPIEEKTNLPYKSKIPGKMHACGHDIHMTVGIETAKILNQKKAELCGQCGSHQFDSDNRRSIIRNFRQIQRRLRWELGIFQKLFYL